MTREIKFRGWMKEEKSMLYDHDMLILLLDDINYYGADNAVLMQFTNLLDKNGKEIYEGDIVEWYPKKTGIVEYVDDMFHIKSLEYPNLSNGNYRLASITCEIIGNIYENPELLTQK